MGRNTLARIPHGCPMGGTNTVEGQCDYINCNYPFCVEEVKERDDVDEHWESFASEAYSNR